MNKSIFVSQSLVSTATNRTRPRMAWLRTVPAMDDAFRAALDYLRANPGGQAVTAALLGALDPATVAMLVELKCPGATTNPVHHKKYLRQLKQELGLFAPIRLAELLGAEHIETLRDSQSRTASPRKLPPAFKHVNWVTNYTPHRLTPRGQELLAAMPTTERSTERLPGLRGRVGFTGVYETINREERNLAAILFALLQQGDNLSRLLRLVVGSAAHHDALIDAAVFFEFAMLRDLWSVHVSRNNDMAREVILDYLAAAPTHLRSCSVEAFNTFWGVSRPSSEWIQMPGRWSLQRMDETIADSALLLRACMLKWSFNAKPDMVIRTARNAAVCIEMKLESGIGSYPASAADKAVFKRRGLQAVRQTEVQRFMMQDLLGFETTFVLLSPRAGAAEGAHGALTWSDLLLALDLSAAPAFAKRTISAVLCR